jgi:hypothetical protein
MGGIIFHRGVEVVIPGIRFFNEGGGLIERQAEVMSFLTFSSPFPFPLFVHWLPVYRCR